MAGRRLRGAVAALRRGLLQLLLPLPEAGRAPARRDRAVHRLAATHQAAMVPGGDREAGREGARLAMHLWIEDISKRQHAPVGAKTACHLREGCDQISRMTRQNFDRSL